METLAAVLAQGDPAEYERMFHAFAGVYLLLLALGLVLFLFVWGMIFSRAGYSFAMALLMFIPLVDLKRGRSSLAIMTLPVITI